MFQRRLSFLHGIDPSPLCCSIEGGGAAGGGGAPADFTPDQLDKLQMIAAGVVNQTMTARLKSFEKQLHESLGKTVGDQLKEHLKGASAQPPGDDAGEGKKGKREQAPGVDTTMVNTLQTQLAELNRRYEAAERQAAEEREKNRGASLRQRLAEELARIGVTNAEQQEIAVGYLVDSKKAVKFDVEGGDENRVVFMDEQGGVVNLDVGLRGWSKTPRAKFFLPPTGAKGAGTRPGGYNGGIAAPPLSQGEQQARVWGALTEQFLK